MIETCAYCGMQHHLMNVYELTDRVNAEHKPRMIYVCSVRLDEDGEIVESDCKDQALADGYKFRRDLTPGR